MNETAIERVIKLQQELDSAREETIQTLIAEINTNREHLKVLGHEASDVAKPKKHARKPCSRCGAKDHDARFHRGETSKAPPAPLS